MGLSNAELARVANAAYPAGAATQYVGYSTNGTSETGILTRTAVGTWNNAASANPALKANTVLLETAAATGAGTVTHFAIFSASTGGTQLSGWTALAAAQSLSVGAKLQWAVGDLEIAFS